MDLVEYRQALWGEPVGRLFQAIYPQWDAARWRRMAYDEGLPLHLITLLAVAEETVVGQINVFRIRAGAELANVGYHVHPRWQRQGIGSALLREVLARADTSPGDGLLVQTKRSNLASRRLAEKFGFRPASDDLIRRYGGALRVLAEPDGLCLHLARSATCCETPLVD